LCSVTNFEEEKKSLKCKVTKLHVLEALKQRISKKKFECKLAELHTFGGEKESPKRSLNASLQILEKIKNFPNEV
jgi:hypothetical protein